MFAGTLASTTTSGRVDLFSLEEGWVGGEGLLVWGAYTHSFMTGESGFFGFLGVGVSSGPLAGGQLGLFLEPGEIGIYSEGHEGLSAGGAGFGIKICNH